jgi:hypothetical protein
MNNSFYKPKNEFGDLLASEKYVIKSVQELSDKHNSDLENLEVKHNADIKDVLANVTALDERPPFKIKFIEDGSPIEVYINNAWMSCETEDEKLKLKVDIGRTLYLRKTGEGDNAQYEEYICTNPGNIDLTDDTIGNDVHFNRLGAVEAIVATTNRFGSVTLEHSIYNNTLEQWNNYTTVVQVAGEDTDTHLPKEGLAVAPCALYDFFVADENLRKELAAEIAERIAKDTLIEERLEKAESDITNNISRLTTAETNIKHIKEELLGVIESEKEGIQNTRLDVNETDIKSIKDIIGINGCCPNCSENECSCTCDSSGLDCTIICKLHNLEAGLTDNSDQIANVDDKLEDELRPAIQTNTDSINIINRTIGTKHDTTRAESICGAVNELFDITKSNNDSIIANAEKISALESNVGIRPDDGYADSLWVQAKRVNDSLKEMSNLITANKSEVDEKIGTRPTDGTVAENIWSQLVSSQNAITKNKELIDANKSEVDKKIGTQPKDTTDIWTYITESKAIIDENTSNISKLSENIATNQNSIGAIEGDIKVIKENIGETSHYPDAAGSIYARIKHNLETFNTYKSDNDNTIGKINEDLDKAEEAIDSLDKRVVEAESIANAAKDKAEEIFKAHHVFNNLVISCDIPGENFNNGEDQIEATIAIPYDFIADSIKAETGVDIPSSDLTIIFNSARFTVTELELLEGLTPEHIIPEVSYDGTVDIDNISHRALTLTFAGYNVARSVLISLTYYNNKEVQPRKVNVLKIS